MHLESDNTETKKSIYNLYISELIDNYSNNRWNSVLKKSSFTHIQSLFFFFLHFGEEKKSRCRLRGLVRNCVYQRTSKNTAKISRLWWFFSSTKQLK